jgi:hypothetical protein
MPMNLENNLQPRRVQIGDQYELYYAGKLRRVKVTSEALDPSRIAGKRWVWLQTLEPSSRWILDNGCGYYTEFMRSEEFLQTTAKLVGTRITEGGK